MHLVGCAEVGGLVADVTLTPSDGVDLSEELDECLTQTLLSLRLPASFVSGEMEVPLVFRVGGDRSSGPAPGDRPVYRVPGPPGGDELIDGAREALQRGDFEEALSLCGAALARQPDDQPALTVCVIAACNAGDGDRAQRHATAITAPERAAMLRQICLRHGVELAGP
jgi:hypothetical protein